MYNTQAWQDDAAGGTPITAAALNHMETGIDDAHTLVGQAQATADDASTKADNALVSGNVTVDSTGLVVVTSGNVQGALAQLDAATETALQPGTKGTLHAGLVLDQAPGNDVINTAVRSHLLIQPSDANPNANAITIKRPSHAAAGWGNKDVPYGSGQAFELLSDSATDESVSTDPTNPVLFRIDSFGGLGACHGLHVATGLRMQSDAFFPSQGIWVDPTIDSVGLIMDNPTTTELATAPTSDFLLIRDVRTTPVYQLVRVTADGTLQSNKAFVATSRAVGDVTAQLKAVTGQTANVLETFDKNGTKRFQIDSGSGLAAGAGDTSGNSWALAAANAGNAGYRAIFQAMNTGVHILALTSPAAYTADHIQVIPSGGTKFRVNKAGYVVTKLNVGPVLADLTDGEATFWLDTANNAFKISARVAGVLKTGTVAVA